MSGTVRRYNPLTKRNYLESGWTGRIEKYMFDKLEDGLVMLPDNFEELLTEPSKKLDATRISISSFDSVEEPKIKMSEGEDSGTV